jgi:hypothetical protein
MRYFALLLLWVAQLQAAVTATLDPNDTLTFQGGDGSIGTYVVNTSDATVYGFAYQRDVSIYQIFILVVSGRNLNQAYQIQLPLVNAVGTTVIQPLLSVTVPATADINKNGRVDLPDLQEWQNRWLETNCGPYDNWCGRADINRDGIVNLKDYGVMVSLWLR